MSVVDGVFERYPNQVPKLWVICAKCGRRYVTTAYPSRVRQLRACVVCVVRPKRAGSSWCRPIRSRSLHIGISGCKTYRTPWTRR